MSCSPALAPDLAQRPRTRPADARVKARAATSAPLPAAPDYDARETDDGFDD
ncbi:hypothetical protein [Amycolatopsis sp. WAC 01375]|uniref:hypothetical protein n=1 Tax=Amycolatopsis sp. WAC 01375 TaxID=2203194 RepID=UPI0013156BB2|nr:hypothetical protein [Amycolatopsis sp. WAC 01375]